MKKRSVKISGHPTSITLEEEFWNALKSCAEGSDLSINQLVTKIDQARAKEMNLSSAVRVYLLRAVSATVRKDQ